VNDASCSRSGLAFGGSRCAALGLRPALRCNATLLNVSSPLLLLSRPVPSENEEGLPLPLPRVMSVAARPPPARALVAVLRLVGLLGLCVCVM
jgi:hypothetical protein